MRYARIFNAIKNEIWCIKPDMLQSMSTVLRSAMLGNLVRLEDAGLPVKPIDTASQEPGQVGVVSIQGVLGKYLTGLEAECGGASVEAVEANLVAAAEDETVSNILLHIDSPGGGVTGIPELAKTIRKIDSEVKPVYAFTDSMAASAAYWLASAARGVFVTETAELGSIGVYVAYIDESEWMAKEGYKLELFRAGKHKAAGLSGVEMTEEDRGIIQGQVDDVYKLFTGFVSGERPQVGQESMEGQTFMGVKALEAGLVDEIVGGIGEVVENIAAS